jgi:excisionase family DNA binding protein
MMPRRANAKPEGLRAEGGMNEVMTLEEVADYLRVHYTTVRRWCRGGELPALKVGRTYRVRRADLEDWWTRQARVARLAEDEDPSAGE